VETRSYIHIVAAAVLFFNVIGVSSGEDADKKPRNVFLSARLLAMGNVQTPVDTGIYAFGNNPATLSLNPTFGFSFTERPLPAPSSHIITAGTAVPFGPRKNLAIGYDDLRVGGVEGYDSSDNPTGTFTYHDRTIAVGYAYKFGGIFAVGGDLMYHRLSYELSSYSATTADLGIVVDPIPQGYRIQKKYGILTLGLSLNNVLIADFDYPSGYYKTPIGLNLGAAWSKEFIKNNEITVAFEHSTDDVGPFHIGFEYSYAYTVHGRIGHDGTNPTFGVGFSQNLFDFDYALIKTELGYEHVATFSLYPGRDVRAEAEKRRAIETWINEGRAYFEAGSYELAIRRFNNVLEWEPDNETAKQYLIRAKYEAYLDEGRSFLKKNNWDRARRAFNAALNIMPGDFLAQQYIERADYLEREAVRLAAIDAEVDEILGEVEKLNNRGLYGRSIALLEETIKEIPDRDELLTALAASRRYLAAAGTTSVPIGEPLPKEIPAVVISRYELADGLLTAGDLTGAINALEPIVEEYPYFYEASSRLVESYMYRGLDLYSKGYIESALVYWRKVLAIDPGNAKAKRYVDKAEHEIKIIRGGD
jgi:tetratricopeptide (TPR) repeat protein